MRGTSPRTGSTFLQTHGRTAMTVIVEGATHPIAGVNVDAGLHVVFGTGQVGQASPPTWPGRARGAGGVAAPASALADGSSGGPLMSPIPKQRPTPPKAHR